MSNELNNILNIFSNEDIYNIYTESHIKFIIIVHKNKDLVHIKGIYGVDDVTKEVRVVHDYLKSIEHNKRLIILENLINSNKGVNKYNL